MVATPFTRTVSVPDGSGGTYTWTTTTLFPDDPSRRESHVVHTDERGVEIGRGDRTVFTDANGDTRTQDRSSSTDPDTGTVTTQERDEVRFTSDPEGADSKRSSGTSRTVETDTNGNVTETHGVRGVDSDGNRSFTESATDSNTGLTTVTTTTVDSTGAGTRHTSLVDGDGNLVLDPQGNPVQDDQEDVMLDPEGTDNSDGTFDTDPNAALDQPGGTDSGTGDIVASSETDSGTTDPGETDSGETDSGETDSGETDPGETDSGETDLGETNAGETDSGETGTDETDAGGTDGAEAGSGEPDGGTDTGSGEPGSGTDGESGGSGESGSEGGSGGGTDREGSGIDKDPFFGLPVVKAEDESDR